MMRMVFLLLFIASKISAEAQSPRFSMTYNIGETTAFMLANKLLVNNKLIYIPLHFDANLSFNDWLGLSLGLVYRYENYQDQGPLYSPRGKVRPTQIWTQYNEIFLLAGPRFSPLKTGLEGFYISTKAGLGTAFSPKYWNLSMLVQPEIGYAFAFNNPGFNLTLGAGLLYNLPFYENIDFVVPWNNKSSSFNIIGILVHQAIPIINIGIGFNI